MRTHAVFTGKESLSLYILVGGKRKMYVHKMRVRDLVRKNKIPMEYTVE